MKHAAFSPSASPRWANCTASFYVNEAKGIKGEETIYSREGTIAHNIASIVLRGNTELKSFLGYQEPFKNDTIRFDQEKLDRIQDYIDIVMSYAREGELHVEEKVYVDDDIWGTSDARVVTPGTMHIFDLKFGVGETIEVKENEQMINYAEGAMNEIDPLEYDIKEVVMHIVQPRRPDGQIHTFWTCPLNKLADHMDRIREAKETIKKGPKYTSFNAGEKQCRWCNYKGECKTYADYSLGVASLKFSQFVEDKPQVVGEALGLIDDSYLNISDEQLLAMIKDKKFKILKTWIEAMQTEALRRAIKRRKEGKDLCGLKIVASVKHRKFVSESKVENYVKQVLKKKPEEFSETDFYTEPKLRSPAQFEKGPLKKLPEKVRQKFEALIFKPQGDPQLVDANDNRAELPIDAETRFSGYADEER